MGHDHRQGDDRDHAAGPGRAIRPAPGKRTRTERLPPGRAAAKPTPAAGAAKPAAQPAAPVDDPFGLHLPGAGLPQSTLLDPAGQSHGLDRDGSSFVDPSDDVDHDGHAEPIKPRAPRRAPQPDDGQAQAPIDRPEPTAHGTDHARELAGHGTKATAAAHALAASLVPAYVAARDALDLAGLQQLAADIYRVYESIATVEDELAPYLRPFTADDRVTRDQAADQGTLAPLAGSLGFALTSANAALADHLGPVAFRGVVVPGSHLGPMPGNARLGLGRILGETIRTGGVVATVIEVRDLVPLAGPMSPQEARTVADKIAPLASRPVHFTFVKTALRALGLWHLVENTTAGDGRKLAQVDHDAKVQADRFGAGADLGGFHPDQALALLRPRFDQPNDYEVSEARAAKVLALVETVADPAARGGILEELHRLQLLEPVVELAPFAKARRLHDGLPPDQFKRVRTILRHRFEGKDTSDTTLSHYAGKVPGGSTAVTVANFLSVGFIDQHDGAHRAMREGEITENQFLDRVDSAVARTAVVGGLSYATGGAFGSFAEGLTGTLAATGTLGRIAAGSMVGAAGGAGGALGARAGSDIVDGDLSALDQYGHDMTLGAGVGAAIGGGLAAAGAAGAGIAGRVPDNLKTPIHWIAERLPRITADPDFFGALRELGARQSKGFATFVTSPARALQHIRDGIAEASADVLATFQGFGPDGALAGGGRVRLTIEARGNLHEPGPARPPLVHIQHAERLGDEGLGNLLGDGPESKGMQIVDGAADSTRQQQATAAATRSAIGSRTALAEHIPPPGPEFVEWFDSLTLKELERFLDDESIGGRIGGEEVIANNIRHPGGQHEWLMVRHQRQIKRWGVPLQTVLDARTATEATVGPRFRHGGAGSGALHRDLSRMIEESASFDAFRIRLNQWADRELFPVRGPNHEPPAGRYYLPANLQVPIR